MFLMAAIQKCCCILHNVFLAAEVIFLRSVAFFAHLLFACDLYAGQLPCLTQQDTTLLGFAESLLAAMQDHRRMCAILGNPLF